MSHEQDSGIPDAMVMANRGLEGQSEELPSEPTEVDLIQGRIEDLGSMVGVLSPEEQGKCIEQCDIVYVASCQAADSDSEEELDQSCSEEELCQMYRSDYGHTGGFGLSRFEAGRK